MSHHNSRLLAGRLACTLAVAGLVGVGLPAVAGASGPQSTTTCKGALAADPKGASSGEPNLVDYNFICNGDISAYTVIVDRRPHNPNVIDDFNSSPLVIQPDGTPSGAESIACSGVIPGDGINCNLGAGGVMTAGNEASGTVDPIDPYCKHFPPGAKPGSFAEPQALVQVVVTDSTGAEDGPFTLNMKPACPAVPNRMPPPAHKARDARRHHAARRHHRHHRHRARHDGRRP
jgi:hypothetical protein